MANRIKFALSATPIETITDANVASHDILASEILKNLGGGGDSLTIAAYSGSAANQGYKDAAVNYKAALYSAGGVKLTDTIPDFIFIKNTGHIFSNATALGAVTTDCILVVLKIEEQGIGGAGGWVNGSDVPVIHYIEIAWLQPGQAMLLPLGSYNKSISQFGAVAYDLSPFNFGANGNIEQGDIELFVKTVKADGTIATTSNAVEYLAVT